MFTAVHYRLLGHTVALLVHGVNTISMLMAMQNEELMQDPEIKHMTSLMTRYMTVWNIGFHWCYFALAFACDILIYKGQERLIPKVLMRIRQNFLATFLWPTTMVVFTIFWPVFLTDRELLFPKYIDKIFSFNNNMAIHFAIFPAVVCEVKLLPRPKPKSHATNLLVMSNLFAAYYFVILYTFFQRGIWPYPILEQAYGTYYFPAVVLSVYFLGVLFYYLQWKLTPEMEKVVKKCKKCKHK